MMKKLLALLLAACLLAAAQACALGETAVSAPQNGRKSGTVTFLLCGKDRASGLCDVILLARLDTKENTAST